MTAHEQAAQLLDVLYQAQGRQLMTAAQRADKMHVLKALYRQRSEALSPERMAQVDALLAAMKAGQ
jgi:hypothetical protein